MKTPTSIRQSKKWVQFEDAMDLEFDQFARSRQDFDVFLRERNDSGDGSNSFTTSSVSSTSSMKEEGPYSAIRGLDQSPEASKDWSLHIDRSPITGWSTEILQSPTVSSTTRNSFIYGSPSMSPTALDNLSPTPSTPNTSLSHEANNPCTDGSPSKSPNPKGLNPFTAKSSISPKVNPFTDGSLGMFPIQKDYLCPPPPATPRRFNPFIEESLSLPNESPTPSGYQCPPSTPTTYITPKVQLKNFKYSDLQELCQSPRFFQEWSLKL